MQRPVQQIRERVRRPIAGEFAAVSAVDIGCIRLFGFSVWSVREDRPTVDPAGLTSRARSHRVLRTSTNQSIESRPRHRSRQQMIDGVQGR